MGHAQGPGAPPRRRFAVRSIAPATAFLVVLLVAAAALVRFAGCGELAPTGGDAPAAGAPHAIARDASSAASAPRPGLPGAGDAGGPTGNASARLRADRPRAEPDPVPATSDPRGAAGDEPARPTPSAAAAETASPRAAVDAVTYGRLTVFGGAGATRSRTLGDRVDIDGDVAVATQWTHGGSAPAGGPFVFERRGGAWTFVQELAPPQYAAGVAKYAFVSGGRIVTVDGFHPHGTSPAARAYLRDRDGAWKPVCEVATGAVGIDHVSDWGFRHGVLVGATWNSLDFVSWRLADGAWKALGPSAMRGISRSWLSFAGDTVAVEGSERSSAQPDARFLVYRRNADRFRREAALTPPAASPQQSFAGATAVGGAALVTVTEGGALAIFERGAGRWEPTVAQKLGVEVSLGGRPVAADGDLAVVIARDPALSQRFVVLQRRPDGWHRTDIALPSRDDAADVTRGASVAMSGRTVVLGTLWETRTGATGGRVGFLEITDEDLARATKLEPVAR